MAATLYYLETDCLRNISVNTLHEGNDDGGGGGSGSDNTKEVTAYSSSTYDKTPTRLCYSTCHVFIFISVEVQTGQSCNKYFE
jgi:hypothetical protein